MKAEDGGGKKRGGKRQKPPPRWRRHLVQAELELPPPYASGTRSLPLEAPQGDDDARPEVELAWWQRLPTVAGLVVLCIAMLVTTIVALHRAGVEHELAAEAELRVQTLTLRATSTERALRIEPNHQGYSSTPDAVLRWPEPPEQWDFYFPVAYADYPAFAITVDKVDQGRAMIVQRAVPDSNRELRLSLNSSAFGPGEYRVRLQGYTWRGDRVDVGWVRITVR